MFAGKKKDSELTFGELCNLLHAFYQYGGEKVVFSGGEVTMRTDLLAILKVAHELGLEVNVLTNGVQWTSSFISEAAPYIDRLQVSIDGYSEETNSKIRGKNNFDKALCTVDNFIKNNVYTEVAMTPLFDHNLKNEIAKYVSFGKFLLKKYENSNFSIKFTGDIMDGRNVRFSKKQKNEYLKIIEKIFIGCYGDVKDIPFIEFHKKGGLQDNCSFGNISITSDGDLYFCADIFPLKPFANIRETTYENMFKLSEIAKQKSHVDNLLPCKYCELKFICGGDCRIKYFKDFIEEPIETMGEAHRNCSQAIKNEYYDLMIRTNPDIFI